MSNKQAVSLVDYETLVPNTATVAGMWKSSVGDAFILTDEAVYRTSLTETSGAMICVPYEEMTTYSISNNRVEPDYTGALGIAAVGVLFFGCALLAGSTLNELVAPLIGLGALFCLAAFIQAAIDMDSAEESTTVTFSYTDNESFTITLDNACGSEVAEVLTENIPVDQS